MPARDDPSGQFSTVASAVRVLIERWWVLLLCAIAGAAVLYGIDQRKTELYEATATLLINAPSVNVTGIVNANASSASADPQRDQGTTLLLVTSTTVAERVRRALRLSDSPRELSDVVTASAEPNANLITITATDADPRCAALLANSFADQYRQFRRDADREGYAQSIREIQQQQTRLPSSVRSQDQYRETLTTLQTLQAASNGGVQVVGTASPPSVPASPRPKRDALLGALLGLAVGAVAIFALDLFDRRLKTIGAFERAYGLVALTSIGVLRSTPRSERDRRANLEPFRILRSGLMALDAAADLRVVLVTSAVSGEGKSSSAAGLAQAFALAGSRVALVELDMRRPTFHRRFDLGGDDRGLTAALIEDVPVVEVARPVGSGTTSFDVLPAGGTPERSAELLSSSAMSRVLDELVEAYDIVVLDAPPLLPVADTRGLLDHRRIDVCLIVGRSHVTTRDQATRTRAIVGQHRVRELGLIVNGLRASGLPDDYAYDDISEGDDGAGLTAERPPSQRVGVGEPR